VEIYLTGTLAFLLAGFVKGVLGFGFPIIALVVMTLSIGLLDALAIILVPTLLTNIWQALDGPYLNDILRRMGLYFALAMIAIFVSSWFLMLVDVNGLTAILGGVLFFFALSRLFNFHITVPRNREGVLSVVLGTVNGFLTGFTGSFMVPSVLYMQALGFQRDMLVQAMGTYFALSTFMLAVSLGRNDLLNLNDALASTFALVPSFLGIFAGRWTRSRIDEQQFQRVFLFGVLLLGGFITYRSGAALV
jgi:uncharacterized membrane protein YfcA